MKKIYLQLLILLAVQEASAFEYPYTLRSPRGLLMGDAFTALNDDEYTLFYNPASMARHKSDLTLYPFSGHISATNVLNDMDRFKDFPDEPVGVADVMMDYPVHASAGVAPGIKMFNVGLTFIASDSFDAILRNKTHPMLDLDLRSDRGVAIGVGVPIGPSRISKKSKIGSQTSLGIGAKFIRRKGVKDTLALAGPTLTDSLGQEEISDVMKKLGQVQGQGWGFDVGVEHIIRRGNSQLVFGLAALDIMDTEYKVDNNPEKLSVASTKGQINLGVAAGQDYTLFHYVLSADIRALNEEMDIKNRVRLGAEIGIPGITVMGGINSGYYSYGAALDFAFMKLTAGFYDIELGSKFKQTQSKRFIIYLSLFNFSFDA